MEWREHNSLVLSWRPLLSWILVLVTLVCCVHGQALSCTGSTQCGSNSMCSNSLCMCNTTYFSVSGLNNDCLSQNDPNGLCSQYDANCIYCGTDFSGPCLTCSGSYFLIESSSSCVSDCPGKASLRFTTVSSGNMILNRVCEGGSTGGSTTGGCTGGSSTLLQWAVIVIGVVAGVIVLAVLVGIVGVSIYILTKSSSSGQFDVEDSQRGLTDSRAATLRTRRSNSFSYHKQENAKEEDNAVELENPAFEDIDGDDETVFRHKLDYLRSQAEIFLKMLNDMRRRLKELPPDAPAALQ